jgi:hypothetical protein
MRKYFQIFFLGLIALGLQNLWAQDKVVLLNGDTLPCKIPGNPKKETDLNARALGNMNDYGFKTVVVIYPGDSIRIHRPVEIKGYVKKERGDYLGSGYFFSRIIHERDHLGYKKGTTRPVFLQRVNFHKDYTIWFYREDFFDATPDTYFLVEAKGREGYDLITGYSGWKKWAVNHPPLGELTFEKGKPKKKVKSRTGSFFLYLVEIMDEYKKRYP